MTDTQELERVRTLMENLLTTVETEGRGKIDFQLRELRRGIAELSRLSAGEGNPDGIRPELSRIGRNLYPARGGLTDFYVWKDDEAERIAINTRIGRLNDALWNLLS